MSSQLTLPQAAHERRSIYQLQKASTISDARIKEIVHDAIREVPSSFNSQSTRLVVLVKDEHDKFWDIVTDVLKSIVPEDKWESTAGRLAGFKGGYGTVSTRAPSFRLTTRSTSHIAPPPHQPYH
jgi:predicted oxidoreductase (fatty acid repression mutant protein)